MIGSPYCCYYYCYYYSEFDGGDGQMGVAGDGDASLEKFDMSEMAKSKAMSAKNAWGKTTGYADQLIDQGVEAQRAQQLENWKNQQEGKSISQKKKDSVIYEWMILIMIVRRKTNNLLLFLTLL